MCLNALLIQMGSLPLIGLPAADIDVDLVAGVAGRPLLLLCDNVWDSAHLQRLLAHFKSRSKASVVIATSRSTRYFPRSTWLQVAVAPVADLLVREQIISAYAGMSFNGLSHAARQHLDSILVKSSGLPLALQAVGRYIAIEEDPTDARSWQVRAQQMACRQLHASKRLTFCTWQSLGTYNAQFKLLLSALLRGHARVFHVAQIPQCGPNLLKMLACFSLCSFYRSC